MLHYLPLGCFGCRAYIVLLCICTYTQILSISINIGSLAAGRHEDFKRSDCFVCAISTHGAEFPEEEIHNAQQEVHRIERPAGQAAYKHHICGVNGRHDVLPTHTIIEMFSKIPALKGKPKLFFIQVSGKLFRVHLFPCYFLFIH